jgi:hypothetical protein
LKQRSFEAGHSIAAAICQRRVARCIIHPEFSLHGPRAWPLMSVDNGAGFDAWRASRAICSGEKWIFYG